MVVHGQLATDALLTSPTKPQGSAGIQIMSSRSCMERRERRRGKQGETFLVRVLEDTEVIES